MKRYPDGISPKVLAKLVQNKDWIGLHRSNLSSIVAELQNLSGGWSKTAPTVLEECFLPRLRKEEKDHLRYKIREWWQLAWCKNMWAHQSMRLARNEPLFDMVNWRQAIQAAEKWPKWPVDSKAIDSLSPEEVQRRIDATLITKGLEMKWAGLTSLYISEHFYAFESLTKALCSVCCIDFLLKILDPNAIIQHSELQKALKRLGAPRRKSKICRLCSYSHKCEAHREFVLFAAGYVALTHMRMVKDYRNVFMALSDELRGYLESDFFNLAQELVFLIEEYSDKAFGQFLGRPLSNRQHVRILDDLLTSHKRSNTHMP